MTRMTGPDGAVICNFINPDRQREPTATVSIEPGDMKDTNLLIKSKSKLSEFEVFPERALFRRERRSTERSVARHVPGIILYYSTYG